MKKLIDFAAISDVDAAKPKIVGKYLLGGFLSTNATLNRTLMGNQEWSGAFCDRLEKFPVLYNPLMNFLGVDPVTRQGVANKPDEATQKAIVKYLIDTPLSRAELHAREAVWQIMKFCEPAIAVPAADASHAASSAARQRFRAAMDTLNTWDAAGSARVNAAAQAGANIRRAQRAHNEQLKAMARRQTPRAAGAPDFAPAKDPQRWRNRGRKAVSVLRSPLLPVGTALTFGLGGTAADMMIYGPSVHSVFGWVVEAAVYGGFTGGAVAAAQNFVAKPTLKKLGVGLAVGSVIFAGTVVGVETLADNGVVFPLKNRDPLVHKAYVIDDFFTRSRFSHTPPAPFTLHAGAAKALTPASVFEKEDDVHRRGVRPVGGLSQTATYCVLSVDEANNTAKIKMPSNVPNRFAGREVFVEATDMQSLGDSTVCPPATLTTGALAPRTESVQTAALMVPPNAAQARLGAETRTAARFARNAASANVR